jgi:hypothetical protein
MTLWRWILGGVAWLAVMGLVWRARRRVNYEQKIELTDKRRAEFSDDERH